MTLVNTYSEQRVQHLTFLQAAITRMSDSSAAIKRHAIVVSLAVLGSAQLSHQKVLAVAGVAITFVFALLDASYLRRERGFRLLYDEVRSELSEKVVDVRMNPPINSHSLRNSLFSWSVGGLYISLAAVQLVAIFCLELYKMPAGLASLLEQTRRRRVFFSFHYQEDCFRVNQIRNSWRIGHEGDREAAGFFDASLWETSQRKSADSLKALIRDGLKNTSVTCVLVGEHTYSRRWVKYEIAQSLACGNGLFAVSLEGLKSGGLLGALSPGGPNPLDYLGIYANQEGEFYIYEKRQAGLMSQDKWLPYGEHTLKIALPAAWEPPNQGYVRPLSAYCPIYHYKTQSGYERFGSWADSAARAVGRL